MAAGILKHLYAQENIQGAVDSAGTADWNVGKAADHRAVATARANGIDISSHRARQVRLDDFSKFDMIVAMDRQNAANLCKTAPPHLKHKVRLLGEDTEIADPYHGNEAGFRTAFTMIEQGCMELIRSEIS